MESLSPYSQFIRFVNTYSIWVALGSFSSHLFFYKVYGTEPNYVIAIGLALGVWFIYTLDHLLDGIQLGDAAVTIRHRVHFDHRMHIKRLLIVVAVILIVLGYWVPVGYYKFIALLAGLTFFHFFMNYLVPQRVKRLLFLKEVFIAVVVSIGLATSATIGEKMIKYSENTAPFWIFLLINLGNIILFSYFDREVDKRSKTLSIAGLYSDNTLRRIIYLCLLVSISLGIWDVVNEKIALGGFSIFLLMQITLLGIALFSEKFKTNDLYRFWGDFIYVYPLFALPFL